MENLFTRNELILFKIIGWVIAIIMPVILYHWNSKELKESEKKQEKRTNDLWQKLQKETKDRMELERKMVEENAKRWNFLYQREKEMKEKHCELVAEKEKEVRDLRKQLSEEGIPQDEHDISDSRRRKNAIIFVKKYWKSKQNKSGKINGRTIVEVLGGENWENIFKDKEGKDIMKLRDWLIKKIDDELKFLKE